MLNNEKEKTAVVQFKTGHQSAIKDTKSILYNMKMSISQTFCHDVKIHYNIPSKHSRINNISSRELSIQSFSFL